MQISFLHLLETGNAFNRPGRSQHMTQDVYKRQASICETGIGGFQALTTLSVSTDPDRCSIPFDKERNGFVMGEGAAVVVLEELEHARKRGARIYGEIAGYGATSDAHHITAPADDGEGAARAMELALKEGGLEKEALTYIDVYKRQHLSSGR